MSEAGGPSARAQLLDRIVDMRDAPGESGPLAWRDVAFLVHGMAFAPAPLHLATGAITARYDLGPRGTWMLNLVSIGISHPYELAEVLRIGRSLVSAELTRLTEAGLIVARPGSRDRRRSELALTRLGEETLEELRTELARLIGETLGHYSPEQLRLCGRVLADMQNALRSR